MHYFWLLRKAEFSNIILLHFDIYVYDVELFFYLSLRVETWSQLMRKSASDAVKKAKKLFETHWELQNLLLFASKKFLCSPLMLVSTQLKVLTEIDFISSISWQHYSVLAVLETLSVIANTRTISLGCFQPANKDF